MKIVSVESNGKSFQNWDYDALCKLLGKPIVDGLLLEQERAKVMELRRTSYTKESDPLHMEWQYDQTPDKEQAWRDKVAEIKLRYPLPTES